MKQTGRDLNEPDWQMNLMNGRYWYVATGDKRYFSMDLVPSPAGRMEDMNTSTHAMWPCTHTPACTVTHTQAKQVWSPLYCRFTLHSSDISNHLICPVLQLSAFRHTLVRLTLCQVPSNPVFSTILLKYTCFSIPNVTIPPHFSG